MSPLSTLAKAESLLNRDRSFAAIATLEKILDVDPNHLGALELLAKAHWRSGQHEAALDTLRHLIRINPYEPGYMYLAAGAHQALGHYGEAVRAYERCLDSGNPSLSKAAELSIQELEGWQESVIAELIQSDPAFRAEYRQAPMEACRNRGFAFGRASASRPATTVDRPQLTIWERPS